MHKLPLKRIIGGSFSCLVLSLATACGTIDMKLPGNRFDSPEARGELLKGSVHAAYAGSSNFELVPSITAVPLQTNKPTVKNSQLDPRLDGRLGLHKHVDVTMRLANDAPTTMGVKVQVLGDPEMTAKPSNFSAAISAAAGIGTDKQKAMSILGGPNAQYSGTYTLADLGFIFGYRTSENSLIYGGPFVTKLWVQGAVNQPEANPFQNAVTGQGVQPGFNIGGQFDRDVVILKIEAAYLSPFYSGASHKNLMAVGGQLGIRW